VDDTNENLNFMRYLLKDVKAHIYTANSGSEAIELIQSKAFNLALIDINMPLMNGFELASIINKDKQVPPMPIIFITAVQPLEEDVLKGFEVGAVDFIVKPFLKQVFVSKIEVFLELFKQKKENLKHQFRLEKTMEIGKIGTWEMNLKTNNLYWSEQNYENFELNLNTPLTFEKYLSIIHPNDRAFVQKEWNNALKGSNFDIEYRLLIGKKLKWIKEKALFEYESPNNAVRAVGFTQDITIIKENEKELQYKEAFNYAIFQNNPIPTIIVDNEGRIIDYNKAQKDSSVKPLAMGKIMYKEYASRHKINMYDELINCIKTQTAKTFTE